jgi:hypothetical protein
MRVPFFVAQKWPIAPFFAPYATDHKGSPEPFVWLVLETPKMAYMFKRGSTYYVKYYVGRKQKEKSLRTDSLQIAKERKRELESALVHGGDSRVRPWRRAMRSTLDRAHCQRDASSFGDIATVALIFLATCRSVWLHGPPVRAAIR